jgi:hypothetical protein
MKTAITILSIYIVIGLISMFFGGVIYYVTKSMELPLIISTLFIGVAFGAIATVAVYSFFFYTEKPKYNPYEKSKN